VLAFRVLYGRLSQSSHFPLLNISIFKIGWISQSVWRYFFNIILVLSVNSYSRASPFLRDVAGCWRGVGL
jgi:hypothetical protein